MQHQSIPIRRRRKTLTNQEVGQNNSSSREASAESNDETETDTASLSTASITTNTTPPSPNNNNNNNMISTGNHSFNKPSHLKRTPILTSRVLPDEEGGESELSEGHDGDISSATAPSSRSHHVYPHPHSSTSTLSLATETESGILEPSSSHPFQQQSTEDSSTSTSPILLRPTRKLSPPPPTTSAALPQILTSGGASSKPMSNNPSSSNTPASATTGINYDQSSPPSPHHSPKAVAASRYPGHGSEEAPPAWQSAPTGFLANLTAEDIQDHIKIAIAGDPASRTYSIKAPPVGRPVRIYADGVYDLLHYGHMLQLRQCKLAFPSVHLMVGVCSSSLVRKYKAPPVLTSEERYESVRHCKWVDEVIEEAPWTVDEEFLKQHKIDYVAHDEEPYVSAGSEDVYAYAKSIGAFLPTKRTNGVSTSELLQRIVEGYREGEFDGKLIKLDRPDLCSTRAPSEAGTNKSTNNHNFSNHNNVNSNGNGGGLDNSMTSSQILVAPDVPTVVEETNGNGNGKVEKEEGEFKLTEEEKTEELLRKLEVNA